MTLSSPLSSVSVLNSPDNDSAIDSTQQRTVRIHPPDRTPTKGQKLVHFLRHAEGTHNVSQNYADVQNMDARLTPKGIQQCRQLAESLRRRDFVPSLVVTSPLTRCIQTALHSLEPLDLNFVAHEAIRETVNYPCDRRRCISEIAAEYPRVDFQHLSDNHDALWERYGQPPCDGSSLLHRESHRLLDVADRARTFLEWLSKRPESSVIVCTHSAFLRCFLNYGLQGGVPREMEQREREAVPVPVVEYCGDDDFERFMRSDYENCEMRSCLVDFS